MVLHEVVLKENKAAEEAESQTQKLIARFAKLVDEFEIANDGDVESAHSFFLRAKEIRQVVQDLTEPFRDKAYSHYKDVQQTQKGLLEPLDDIVDALRGKVASYYERAVQRLTEYFVAAIRDGGGNVVAIDTQEPEDAIEAITDRFEIRKYYSATVTDIEEFIAFVVRERRYDLVEANYKELNAMARKMGSALGIDGIEVNTKTTPVPLSK
jgi:hypothetical protein